MIIVRTAVLVKAIAMLIVVRVLVIVIPVL